MKFVLNVVLAVALSTVGAYGAKEEHALTKEDEAFWGRFLEGGTSSIPPIEPCLVEVDITCVTSDGTECADIPPPPPPELQTEELCIDEVCYNIVIGKKIMVLCEILRMVFCFLADSSRRWFRFSRPARLVDPTILLSATSTANYRN